MNSRRPSAGDRRRTAASPWPRPRPARRRSTGRPARPQRRRDPVGSDPPVRARRTPPARRRPPSPRRRAPGPAPSAATVPVSSRAAAASQQRDPGRPPPRAAQPRRGGHDHGRRGGEQRRAGERGAGQPRAARAGWPRPRAGCPPPTRYEDPCRAAAAATAPAARPASSRNRRLRSAAATTTAAATRQATCTRPVMTRPAVPETAGHGAAGPSSQPERGRRGGERARPAAGPPRSAGSRRPDDGSGRTAGRGPCRRVTRRDRDRGAAHRRSAGRTVPGTGGWAERAARCAVQRPWSSPTAKAASSAHEVPSRTPARASDSQWAPR